MLRLIDAGYGMLLRRLTVEVVFVNLERSVEVRSVQLMADRHGCALYKDGRCLVHGVGLKPTEGRYFLHPRSDHDISVMRSLHLAVLREWNNPDNRRAADMCFSHLSGQDDEP